MINRVKWVKCLRFCRSNQIWGQTGGGFERRSNQPHPALPSSAVTLENAHDTARGMAAATAAKRAAPKTLGAMTARTFPDVAVQVEFESKL